MKSGFTTDKSIRVRNLTAMIKRASTLLSLASAECKTLPFKLRHKINYSPKKRKRNSGQRYKSCRKVNYISREAHHPANVLLANGT